MKEGRGVMFVTTSPSVTNTTPRPSFIVSINPVRIAITVLPLLKSYKDVRYPLGGVGIDRNWRFCSMKILVLPKPIEGVSREEMLLHAPAEIQAVWELYKQGIVRVFYTRANEPNRVVLMFESASVEAARDALATLPFAQLHLIDFDVIPLAPFYGLEHLSISRS